MIEAVTLGHTPHPAQAFHPYGSHKLAVGVAASVSAAVGTGVGLVQIFSTVDAWVVFGENPTAAADNGLSFFQPAGIFNCYLITPGHKVSAIRDTEDGALHVLEARPLPEARRGA